MKKSDWWLVSVQILLSGACLENHVGCMVCFWLWIQRKFENMFF